MFDSKDKTYIIKPFYLVINHLFGHIEKIEGSNDRHLVVNINNKKQSMFLIEYGNILNVKLLLMEFGNLLKVKLFLMIRMIK